MLLSVSLFPGYQFQDLAALISNLIGRLRNVSGLAEPETIPDSFRCKDRLISSTNCIRLLLKLDLTFLQNMHRNTQTEILPFHPGLMVHLFRMAEILVV